MAVVRYERQERVGHIILDRPPANSYDKTFLDDLSTAIDAARFDAECRAILVRSASEKFFSAGADVKMFASTDAEQQYAFVIHANEIMSKFERTPKVVVAAINGHCLGGGLEIALCADFRIAAEGAYNIGLPEVTLGVLPGTGGTQRLPRLIGRKALDLMLLGAPVKPEKAKELGIVDDVVPAAELLSKAVEWCTAYGTGPTLAIGQIKLAAVLGAGMPFAAAMLFEHQAVGRLFASDDFKEGVKAFTEKRKPEYRGR
ncbi:MAG TPA: enoyl-CoA hydratase/isomerase family protein [Candidatus Limnocylindrales bacterium]|nr:enoyl-CoA hydratase/isomerase family protein [Candidatus Limnocylindrales bacterium]